MIIDGKYELRKGKTGDRPSPNFGGTIISRCGKLIRENIPDYILMYKRAQIGAIHGSASCIRHIEIFDPHKNQGHGTKFIELMEKEAKRLGLNQIEVSPVTVDNLRHILQKRGFKAKNKKSSEKRDYRKKL